MTLFTRQVSLLGQMRAEEVSQDGGMETFFNNTRPTIDPVPMEQFSLNFEEIKVTYRDREHDSWIDIL